MFTTNAMLYGEITAIIHFQVNTGYNPLSEISTVSLAVHDIVNFSCGPQQRYE
jgi:hypothetical protein